MLVENPSSYLRYRHSTIEEPAFLAELARRTGCGLLCDINNIHVSGRNLGFDPLAYLAGLSAAAIGEFHLAGHSVNDVDGQEILIDDHGSAVAEPVWALYRAALRRFGPRPTLVEWDSRLPDYRYCWARPQRPMPPPRILREAGCPGCVTAIRRRPRCARPGRPSLSDAIHGDGIDPAARLRIYRHHYESSLAEALRAIYPVVCRLVDERFFAFAAHEYIRSSPPRRVCLHEYGADFAEFLAGFPPCRELSICRMSPGSSSRSTPPSTRRSRRPWGRRPSSMWLCATIRAWSSGCCPRSVISNPLGPSIASGSVSRRVGGHHRSRRRRLPAGNPPARRGGRLLPPRCAAIHASPRASGRRDVGKRGRSRAGHRSGVRLSMALRRLLAEGLVAGFSLAAPIPSGDDFDDDDPRRVQCEGAATAGAGRRRDRSPRPLSPRHPPTYLPLQRRQRLLQIRPFEDPELGYDDPALRQ